MKAREMPETYSDTAVEINLKEFEQRTEKLLDTFLGELRLKRKTNKLYYTTNPMPTNGEFFEINARAAEKIAEKQNQIKKFFDCKLFPSLDSHEMDFLRYEPMSIEAHKRAIYRDYVMGNFDTKEYTARAKCEDETPPLTAETFMKCIKDLESLQLPKNELRFCPGPDEYVMQTSSLFVGTFISVSGKLFNGGKLIGDAFEKNKEVSSEVSFVDNAL